MDGATLEDLFAAAAGGAPAARQQLFVALYAELKRVATRELRRSGGALTISPTTLLHEAYLDIADRGGLAFPDKARFISYAARAMRGLIIDFIREKLAQKRGAGFELTRLDTADGDRLAPPAEDLSRLNDSLEDLAAMEPALAEVVDLKYFCGFSFEEIAAMRGVSERTVRRDWEKARLLLYQSLQQSLPE